jgi:dipeptidyl aminopeptidase/acylaminoacyl peptidase
VFPNGFYISYPTLVLLSFLACPFPPCEAQQAKKPFTVDDEIGLTLFGIPAGAPPEVLFSPDGKYFAVWTERGRLDLNRPEDSLRFYRSQDVENFLRHSDRRQPAPPVWEINLSTYKEGPIINYWRWLADSSGVAFLQRAESGNKRLVIADLRTEMIEPLTSETEAVKDFDVRNRDHYVYTVVNSSEEKKWRTELQGAVVIGTGRTPLELLFPYDSLTQAVSEAPAYKSHTLWAVVDGKRFEVKNEASPLAFITGLSLSPDGRSLLAKAPVTDVPLSWEALYPPPYKPIWQHVSAGHKNPQTSAVHQYVKVDLQTGSMTSLTNAPTAVDAGWWLFGDPSWSNDGQAMLLPGTFLKTTDDVPSRPCIAIVDLHSNSATCVEMARGRRENGDVEQGYHVVSSARFVRGDRQRVVVKYINHSTFLPESIEYRNAHDGVWQEAAARIKGQSGVGPNGLEVSIKQGFDKPPQLLAAENRVSKIIWNPNPQLGNIELGEAAVYSWKDKNGHEWKGGLYKPVHYEPGHHYPLVIQTHGFVESEFRPSGVFPTAFAARALAAQGIMVLQVGYVGNCIEVTVDEGPCNAAGYEVVANELVSEGLVDPDKIGIIGFSRTCFDVMETLTSSHLQIKAASITDGVMENYLQYMLYPDLFPKEADVMIGAPPFGEGLQLWLKRSPGFNLDKIQAPLLVVAEGRSGVLLMWEPYAGLHLLQKPVEFLMLNNGDEHILTNPAMRLVSQGGSVDWFRFWLQETEDPDPAKTDQYKRWRELRRLHQARNSNSDDATAGSSTPH